MEIIIVLKSKIYTNLQSKFEVDTHTCTMEEIKDKIETAMVEVASKNYEIVKLKSNILCKTQK